MVLEETDFLIPEWNARIYGFCDKSLALMPKERGCAFSNAKPC